tara:strand:- start:162 stop:1307 length:1146 start_codon:yes stop_codon:yes gene_type:complete
MNEVLMRPLFRRKYLERLKKLNSFNKGGLASIQKFNQGGLSEAERRNITLAPFTAALLSGQRRPGESEFSAVARALGKGVATIPETKKTIAAIEQSMAPEERFKIMTKNEIAAANAEGANLNPQGTYQRNLSTGEIKDITKRQLFADPFLTARAGEDAKQYGSVIQAGVTAQEKANTFQILDALANNPDLTLGQFGGLTKSIENFAEGLGFTTGITDLAAADVLQRFAGQKVLADLGQLKGALSEKELAFIQSLNVGLDTPRESLLLIVDLYKKANQKAIDKARLYREHVAETGNPNKPDKQGLTLYQKEAKLMEQTFITPEVEERLKGLKKDFKATDKGFERKRIVADENNLQDIQKKFPDAKVGDKFEIRGETLVQVLN